MQINVRETGQKYINYYDNQGCKKKLKIRTRRYPQTVAELQPKF